MDLKENVMYMNRVYDWVKKNFGMEIEELKKPDYLVRNSGNGRGFVCGKAR